MAGERFNKMVGRSSKTSSKLICTVTEKQRKLLLSVNTNHPGNRSFQGIFRTMLHPQLARGVQLAFNDPQWGTCWRMINEDRGRFGDIARRGLFDAMTRAAGPEALAHAYHGTTDAWCEELLAKLGDLGAQHRANALNVEQGLIGQQAEQFRIEDDGDNEGDYD